MSFTVPARSGTVRFRRFSRLMKDHFPQRLHISEEDYMLAWFAWNRYGKTFKQLLEEDRSGMRQSSMRVLAVNRDYQRWRYAELDPEKAKFKLDREHQVLIQYGLSFGIEALSAEALADCFDALCPCDKPHFPENLRSAPALPGCSVSGCRTGSRIRPSQIAKCNGPQYFSCVPSERRAFLSGYPSHQSR